MKRIEEAEDLSRILGKIWGAATQASREGGGLPVLAPSQARALQGVTRSPGLTPAALAEAMGLSRPVVSDLLRKLEAQGLIARQKSDSDGRSVTLQPTERGTYVQKHYRLGLVDAFSQALGQLPHAQARAILDALPALERLREELEQVSARIHGEAG